MSKADADRAAIMGGEAMKLETLKIKGIGPFHNEIEVPFSKLDNIISISGVNGVGKTFLLECVPGALYNYWPFRMYEQKKSVYDFIFPNAPAFVELVFEIRQRRFRIVRNYTLEGTWQGDEFKERSKNQTAFIYEWDGFDWTPIAEKLSAVDDFVEREICTKQLFLASVFNSQNSAGDLVDVSKTERKDIFASLIGLDPLQERSEFFKGRYAEVGKIIEKDKMQISTYEALVVDKEELKGKVAEFEAAITATESEIELLNQARDSHLKANEREKAEREKSIAQARELMKLKDKLRELEERRAKLEGFVVEAAGLQERADGLATARDLARSELVKLEAEYQAVRNDEEAMGELYDMIAEQKRRIHERRDLFSAEQREIEKAKQGWRNQLSANEAKIVAYETKLESVKRLEALDCPKNCEYVSSAVQHEAELREIDGPALYANRDKYAASIKECDETIREKFSPQALVAAVAPYSEAIVVLEGRLADEKIKQDGIKQIERSIITKREEAEKADAARATIAEKLARLDEVHARIADLNEEIFALRVDLTEREKEVRSIDADAQARPTDYSFLIKQTEATISEKSRAVQNYRAEIVRLQEKLKASSSASLTMKILSGKVDKHLRLQTNYSILQEAFGRNGIQALIIDSEKYQFLEIARELFSILSGGKMALQFETQKMLKKGGEKREDFELYLIVEGVKRELRQCSQGQQDLGRIVMRATLGIYYAQKTGGLMKTYFLDETTGSLDEINRESYLRFLSHLLNHFQQIIVITHQDLGRVIPCKVEIDERRQIRIL